MISLAALGVGLGLVLLLLLRKVSNQEAIRGIRRQLQACLYELRLFVDEPALVWKAQLRLLWLNVRYLALMLRPAFILALPVLFVFSFLEPYFGKAPLALSEPSIVTVKLAGDGDAAVSPPVLQPPAGIDVETPAVRMQGTGLVSWRIRAQKATSGLIRVVFPTEIVKKRIASGTRAQLLSTKRVRSIWQWFWYPTESVLPAGNVEWIEVNYPSRSFSWLGLELPWYAWVLLFSIVTVLVLKKPLHVAF
jgi:hypothetical protein